MMRLSPMKLAALLCVLFLASAVAAEECTIAVACGSATADARPLLWKNRDSDELLQEIRFFDDGLQGGYITVVSTGVEETTTAYIGVNDAGFAIMNANAPDLSTGSPSCHGILMKRALRECGSVDAFEALLFATAGQRGHVWANFGVIDRLGGAAIFEANDWEHRRYDAAAEGGFVVRTNASVWGGGDPGTRYDRAFGLINDAVGQGRLDHVYLIQTVTKDIGGPPSLPCGEWPTTDPAISRSRTQAAGVVHGVLPDEDPRLSTFWCVLGEPSCGVTVPLWSWAGLTPAQMSDPGQIAPMCAAIQQKQLYCYDDLASDYTLNTNALVGDDGTGGIHRYSLPIEGEAFAAVAAVLPGWRLALPAPAEMAQFEIDRTSRAYFLYVNELAPGEEMLPVADFSGAPTSGGLPLTVVFADASVNAEAWFWDFGDSMTSALQNPQHSYEAPGAFTVALTVSNAHGVDTEIKTEYITVTDPNAVIEALALADLPVAGSVAGSYLDTHAGDDVREALTEVLSGNNPHKRTSLLEHRWRFAVTAGAAITFYVEAWRPDNADGDDFLFEYSMDGMEFQPLLTVASAVERSYEAPLPPETSGDVFIRVRDTVHAWGATGLDVLYVDRLAIDSAGGQPLPPVAAFSAAPRSGFVPLVVQFSDESLNGPTSWSWDFGDGETSAEQHPAHGYAAAGIYTVTLTAANAYGSDSHVESDYITADENINASLHVHDIVVYRRNVGSSVRGVAEITIVDGAEQPVSGATVAATATGPVGGDFSGITDALGWVSFETGRIKNPVGEWCFEVTGVAHASLPYDPSANLVTLSCESGDVYRQPPGSEPAALVTLEQNIPDPFNPATSIGFLLAEPAEARLEVFDAAGRRVDVLAVGFLAAGRHQVFWNAGELPSGIYLYRLEAGGAAQTRKMVLLR